jgi:hypothetical protein
MAFDFSAYQPSTPAAAPTAGALPPGITQNDIQQMNYLQANPVANDPSQQMVYDTDGNSMGLMKDLHPDVYQQSEDQWNEQQKLTSAGLLGGPQKVGGADGGDQQTVQYFGGAVPASFAGHSDYNPNTPQGTNQGELGRIVYTGQENDSSGSFDTNKKLIDSNAVYDDPNWGKLTTLANIDQKSPMDTFWKIAPMIPMAIATIMSSGAAAPLFAGLDNAGGATAGAMIGDQTASDIAGGAIAQGGAATAGNALAGSSAWFQKMFPNLVKGGISSLPGGGKNTGISLAEQVAGGALDNSGILASTGGFDWTKYAPLVSAGINIARGGTFDWSRYLPNLALQSIAKGMK